MVGHLSKLHLVYHLISLVFKDSSVLNNHLQVGQGGFGS